MAKTETQHIVKNIVRILLSQNKRIKIFVHGKNNRTVFESNNHIEIKNNYSRFPCGKMIIFKYDQHNRFTLYFSFFYDFQKNVIKPSYFLRNNFDSVYDEAKFLTDIGL